MGIKQKDSGKWANIQYKIQQRGSGANFLQFSFHECDNALHLQRADNKVKKQEENLNLLQYYSLLRKRTAQAHFETLQRVQCDEHFKSMSVYIYKRALVEGNHPRAL